MRLFLALTLSDQAKDYLYSLRTTFNPTWAKINWIAKKNLHLTLKFFGEIPATNIPKLRTHLRTIHCSPITTSLRDCGFFPNDIGPRVLWVSVHPDNDIFTLQKLLDQETLSYGKQEQSFTSHITLGRIKTVKNKTMLLRHAQTLHTQQIPLPFSSFSLLQSTLTKNGPRYTLLEDYPLM